MDRMTLDQLSSKANVSPDLPDSGLLSQQQRLQRWSEVLAREPAKLLSTFPQTEYMSAEIRDSMRCAGSALSVAFADPILRDAGLTDDTYGTAKKFFGLEDRQMHWILCYCHHGVAVRAGDLASVLRSVMRSMPGPGLVGRLRQAFVPREA